MEIEMTATDADLAVTSAETALVPVEQRAALALNSSKTEQHLVELSQKHTSITVIKDKAGREQAHGAAMELLKARTAIEKVSKTARDDATKFSKAVIAEEKRLVAIIEGEEKRLFAVRDVWDAEQERIRQEKVLAEQRRVDRINAAIASIAAIPSNLANAKADVISAAIAELESVSIVEEFYEEFTDKAVYVRSEALQSLNSLYGAAAEREAEAKRLVEEQARIAEENARLAAERAELDRQRRELEEAQARAAAEAAMAAQRAADEANARAKREAAEREAFMRQQQDAFEAEKREAEAKFKAEQDALAAERAELVRLNAERVAKEAEERIAKELAERNAELAKQEEAARLRRAEISERTDTILNDIAGSFQVSRATAIEFVLEAAEFLREEVAA